MIAWSKALVLTSSWFGTLSAEDVCAYSFVSKLSLARFTIGETLSTHKPSLALPERLALSSSQYHVEWKDVQEYCTPIYVFGLGDCLLF